MEQATLSTKPSQKQPRLLEQVRDALRVKHYKYTTEKEYLRRITEYIIFHNKRHPKEMGAKEIRQYLTP